MPFGRRTILAIDSSSEAVTQPVLASTKAQSVPLTAIQIGAVGALQAQVNSTLPAINMGSANTAATQASAIKTALANDLPVSRFAASLAASGMIRGRVVEIGARSCAIGLIREITGDRPVHGSIAVTVDHQLDFKF